jgi:hypothetical protein
MNIRKPAYRSVNSSRHAFGRHACAAVLVAATLAASIATAQELPTLRAGLWEVRRTVEAPSNAGTPRTVQTTECTSPNEGMVARQEMLQKIGCTLSPLAHSTNSYTFSAMCGEGSADTMKSVLTVETDSAYSIRIDSTAGGARSQEWLSAKRVGDC